MMPKKAGMRLLMSVQKWLLRKIKDIDRERMNKHVDAVLNGKKLPPER